MPTQAEIEDFVRRNGEADRGRAVEALTNYTGDRDFDSQSANYDQRTNQLSPQGQAATAQIVRPQPRQLSSLLMAPQPGRPGLGPVDPNAPGSFVGDQRSYPMPVSTGMPVGGGPTLASLLDYAPSFQQFRVR